MKIPNLSDKNLDSSDAFDPLKEDVPASGYSNYSRFIFVGEAPGATEMSRGEPLVGQAGNLFNRILNTLNIPRSHCYLTNFCKTKLPGNSASSLLSKGWKHPSFGELQNRLISELSSVNSPYIILLGDTAIQGLLGESFPVSKYRGSVYHAEDFSHLSALSNKKIILSFHPASALFNRSPMNFYYIMNDISKAIKLESDPSLLDNLNPILHVNPSYQDILDFLNEILSSCSETAFDIEATPAQTTCFSFSLSPSEAMSIPLINNSGNIFSSEQETEIWRLTSQILESPSIGKIMQNGMFDMMFLVRTLGIKTSHLSFDTMLAQHLAWSDLPKGLDFITSVYTFYPYYKDEGKQAHLKTIKDWDQYWRYNARDAIITHSAKAPLQEELNKISANETYQHLLKLHRPLMEMEYRGILTDQNPSSGIPAAQKIINHRIGALQSALDRFCGKPLNVNSPKQMKEYFYVDLELKPYVNRKTKNLSVDDTALKRIARKKSKGSAEAMIIRKIRENRKLMSNYFSVSVDSDSRLRCQYKISGTSTGRLASAKTFFGSGTNLQNIPKAFKSYLIPDPGYFLIEVDLSQAEARVVAYISQDANMIKAFESSIDCHTYNASQIFDVKMENVTKAQRDMGKRVVHASNYAMGYKTFALNAEIPEPRAKSLLNQYHSRFPGLKRWHSEIDREVHQTRMLRNLFNRPKRFLGPLDPIHLKAAYAYIPQSSVAELLNRGLVDISRDDWLKSQDLQLLLTVHDSIIFQIPITSDPVYLSKIFHRVAAHLEKTLYAKGQPFVIPCDFKISTKNWKNMIEVKEISIENLSAAMEKLDVA